MSEDSIKTNAKVRQSGKDEIADAILEHSAQSNTDGNDDGGDNQSGTKTNAAVVEPDNSGNGTFSFSDVPGAAGLLKLFPES